MDQDEAMFGIGVGTTDSMYTVDLSNAPKTKPKTNWTKIGAITLGALVGLSHIGMIGMISRKSEFPVVNVPVGPYTSYMVEADKEGYRISYKANDPKVMRVERDLKEKGGFLGLVTRTLGHTKSTRWMGLNIYSIKNSEMTSQQVESPKHASKQLDQEKEQVEWLGLVLVLLLLLPLLIFPLLGGLLQVLLR